MECLVFVASLKVLNGCLSFVCYHQPERKSRLFSASSFPTHPPPVFYCFSFHGRRSCDRCIGPEKIKYFQSNHRPQKLLLYVRASKFRAAALLPNFLAIAFGLIRKNIQFALKDVLSFRQFRKRADRTSVRVDG